MDFKKIGDLALRIALFCILLKIAYDVLLVEHNIFS